MFLLTFLKGMMIGLAIAAPVGPIAVLTMKTTLAHGRMAGFATGAGAAVADTLYAIIGVFGVVLVMGLLQEYSTIIRIVGGFFLMNIGIKMMFASTESQKDKAIKPLGSKLVKDFVATFFLTLTNPATIVAFIAIFAALGISAGGNAREAVIIVTGVFCGSLLWWLILTNMVALMRKRVNEVWMHRINITAGIAILGFGAAIIISTF